MCVYYLFVFYVFVINHLHVVVWLTGKNLQICFMNETASDNESQASDVERNLNSTKNLSRSSIFTKSNFNHPYQTRPLSVNITKLDKISTMQSGKYFIC